MKKCDYNVSDTRFLYFTARERPRVFHVSHHFQKPVPKTDWQVVASGDCSCKLLNYIVSNAREFDRGLTHLRRQVLRWLDVTDRINYVQTGCPCFPVLTRHGTFVDLSELCRPVLEFDGVNSTYLAIAWHLSEDVRSATQDRKRGTRFRTI